MLVRVTRPRSTRQFSGLFCPSRASSQCFSQASGASRSQHRLSSFLLRAASFCQNKKQGLCICFNVLFSIWNLLHLNTASTQLSIKTSHLEPTRASSSIYFNCAMPALKLKSLVFLLLSLKAPQFAILDTCLALIQEKG